MPDAKLPPATAAPGGRTGHGPAIRPTRCALDERIVVRHGLRGFWVFEGESAGRVRELMSRRDGDPVGWRRVP